MVCACRGWQILGLAVTAVASAHAQFIWSHGKGYRVHMTPELRTLHAVPLVRTETTTRLKWSGLADLDGDGLEERFVFSFQKNPTDGRGRRVSQVFSFSLRRKGNAKPSYLQEGRVKCEASGGVVAYVIDLSALDPYREVAFFDASPSDDPHYHVYRLVMKTGMQRLVHAGDIYGNIRRIGHGVIETTHNTGGWMEFRRHRVGTNPLVKSLSNIAEVRSMCVENLGECREAKIIRGRIAIRDAVREKASTLVLRGKARTYGLGSMIRIDRVHYRNGQGYDKRPVHVQVLRNGRVVDQGWTDLRLVYQSLNLLIAD